MIKDKKKRNIAFAAIAASVLIAVVIVVARYKTGNIQLNGYEEALLGKWAYIHAPKETVSIFRANGKAKFEGKTYHFSSDSDHIYFTDSTGNALNLRYEMQDAKNMVIYPKNLYILEIETTPNGIEGVWDCPEKNLSFEFTDKGTFLEDGILTGYYFVDEENGVIRLVYERYLDDTVMYYQLTDEGLWIEYPWPMIRK